MIYLIWDKYLYYILFGAISFQITVTQDVNIDHLKIPSFQIIPGCTQGKSTFNADTVLENDWDDQIYLKEMITQYEFRRISPQFRTQLSLIKN